MKGWQAEFSNTETPLQSHFIQLGFAGLEKAEQINYFNSIPTSFFLSDEQVDNLIKAGHELLRNNLRFQQFLSEL